MNPWILVVLPLHDRALVQLQPLLWLFIFYKLSFIHGATENVSFLLTPLTELFIQASCLF